MPGKTERDVDRKFVGKVHGLGFQTIKLTTLGARGASGWPDRLVLVPGGGAMFVELKAPGKEATDLQKARHEVLRKLGFVVQVHDDAKKAVHAVMLFARRVAVEAAER